MHRGSGGQAEYVNAEVGARACSAKSCVSLHLLPSFRNLMLTCAPVLLFVPRVLFTQAIICFPDNLLELSCVNSCTTVIYAGQITVHLICEQLVLRLGAPHVRLVKLELRVLGCGELILFSFLSCYS